METDDQSATRVEVLSRLFGSYKDEWLESDVPGYLHELFVQPSYFPELLTSRPCVIIGGRGTGKTTVLKGLSYQGQYELAGQSASFLDDSTYIGLYHRMNRNVVRGFQGFDLESDRWRRLFSHYFNLIVCLSAAEFVTWHGKHTGREGRQDTEELWRTTSLTLALDETATAEEFKRKAHGALRRFEIAMNSDPHDVGNLSMPGVPIAELFDGLARTVTPTRTYFICVDEFENLLDYQQEAINTLVKHTTPSYTYKIGVRELGWRTRSTLGGDEPLVSPADYVRIDLGERWDGPQFEDFATRVIHERLRRYATELGVDLEDPPDLGALLPSLSTSEEARLLGIDRVRKGFIRELESEVGDTRRAAALQAQLADLSDREFSVIDYWRQAQNLSPADVLDDLRANRSRWETRFVNYAYASLFPIRRGRVGIRKYYAGWRGFLRLSSGNIRYLLSLVEQAISRSLSTDGEIIPTVTPKDQTLAARKVGEITLRELESVEGHGPDLLRLILGLGRIFQLMALRPHGHTPEVNQFYLDLTDENIDDTAKLELERKLTSAVQYLALLREIGTKLTGPTATREHDYRPHPIFSPFFEYSFRRKRKMRMTPEEIIGLLNDPSSTIREVTGRLEVEDSEGYESLPEQLLLFKSYYEANVSA